MHKFGRAIIGAITILATFLIVQPVFAVTYCSTTTYTDFVGFVGTALTVHDSYRVQDPDGTYRNTWHPQTNSKAPGTQHESGCVFGHEHGADPTDTSLQTANNNLPPFGYIAAKAGVTEAHEGYKVIVIHHQDCDLTSHGSIFPEDLMAVVHTGSAAIGRYTARYHSMDISYKGFNINGLHCDGDSLSGTSTLNMSGFTYHVQGMADTGATSINDTVCDSPRRGGKTFSGYAETNPPNNYTGDCTTSGDPNQNAYEVWSGMGIDICPNPTYGSSICGPNQSPIDVSLNPAVNDPISSLKFSEGTPALHYTQDIVHPLLNNATTADSDYLGCNRETDLADHYWNNASGGVNGRSVWYSKTDGTDAQPTSDATHPLRQEVSLNDGSDTSAFYDRAGTHLSGRPGENFCSTGSGSQGTYGVKTPN